MTRYLLDTNVLSELLKKRPERSVVRALNVASANDLYTSSLAHGLVLSTRNANHFEAMKVLRVENWWS